MRTLNLQEGGDCWVRKYCLRSRDILYAYHVCGDITEKILLNKIHIIAHIHPVEIDTVYLHQSTRYYPISLLYELSNRHVCRDRSRSNG